MGLFSLFKRDQGLSTIENPNTPIYQGLLGLDALPSVAGPSVTQETAMRLTAVYAAVSLIASIAGGLPLHVFRRDSEGRRIETRDPATQFIWGRPNPEVVATVFWETVFGHCVAAGNAFIFVMRNGAGNPAELWPIPPATVKVGRDSQARKIYTVGNNAEPFMDYRAGGEVIHIPAFGTNGLVGLSPIGQARQAIGLALAAEESGSRFFANDSTPGGVLATDQQLKDADAERLSRRWERYHRGLKNAHRVAVLDNGAKWQPTSISAKDAQYLETRRFQVAEIARLFRVPPHLIGDVERSTSWGSGIEEQNRAFLTYTMMGWLRRFEQAISDDLLAKSRYAKFNTDGLLRAATLQRFQAYAVGRQWGWLSANDIRELEDMAPIDRGDSYLVPLNMLSLRPGEEQMTEDELNSVRAIASLVRERRQLSGPAG